MSVAVFASAQCPSSLNTFTVPAGDTWLVQQIHFVNTDTTAHYVTFYAKPAGSNIPIINSQVIAGNTTYDLYLTPGLALPAAGTFGFSSDYIGVYCTVMGTRTTP